MNEDQTIVHVVETNLNGALSNVIIEGTAVPIEMLETEEPIETPSTNLETDQTSTSLDSSEPDSETSPPPAASGKRKYVRKVAQTKQERSKSAKKAARAAKTPKSRPKSEGLTPTMMANAERGVYCSSVTWPLALLKRIDREVAANRKAGKDGASRNRLFILAVEKYLR